MTLYSASTHAAGTIAARAVPKVLRVDLLNDGNLEVTTKNIVGEESNTYTIEKSEF